MNARVLPDAAALARAAAELVLEAEAAAGERFAICLTGGTTPQATHAGAQRLHARLTKPLLTGPLRTGYVR